MSGPVDKSGPVEAYRFEHQGLLGTVIDVRVGAHAESSAALADARIALEIERLERVFSAFDASSELCRWRRGEQAVWSVEFNDLMGRALRWHEVSDGGFNPMAGELSARWNEAVEQGRPPSRAAAAAIAQSIAAPRYTVVDGSPVPTGDCSRLTLNAIAKGYIVDRALEVAAAAEVAWVSVNAGGDLAHRGRRPIQVGIENPHRPYDNEPPVAVIELTNQALATSGDARRGYRVGEQWFGHVIDPRSGWPVEEIASISVVAATAETADALATVAGVMPPAAAAAFLDAFDGAEGLVIDRTGHHNETHGWRSLLAS